MDRRFKDFFSRTFNLTKLGERYTGINENGDLITRRAAGYHFSSKRQLQSFEESLRREARAKLSHVQSDRFKSRFLDEYIAVLSYAENYRYPELSKIRLRTVYRENGKTHKQAVIATSVSPFKGATPAFGYRVLGRRCLNPFNLEVKPRVSPISHLRIARRNFIEEAKKRETVE